MRCYARPPQIKVAAAAAVQAAFGGHVEDVRRLAAGLQTRLEDVAQQVRHRTVRAKL